MHFSEIKEFVDTNCPNNLGWGVYGSLIYGTHHKDSDIDVLVLVDSKELLEEKVIGIYNLSFMNIDEFIRKVETCDIKCLEVYMSPISNLKLDLTIDFKNLRDQISRKASHSYVKGKKKIVVENDFYRGLKSLFHSFRILQFGIQLAKNGKIINFASANEFYDEFLLIKSWDEFESGYKVRYNNLHSEFKKTCPKYSGS